MVRSVKRWSRRSVVRGLSATGGCGIGGAGPEQLPELTAEGSGYRWVEGPAGFAILMGEAVVRADVTTVGQVIRSLDRRVNDVAGGGPMADKPGPMEAAHETLVGQPESPQTAVQPPTS
jgi:hypothetical protein